MGDRAETCPLCGGPNACGIAAGATSCWCFETRIPGAALERIPEAARDRSCICQACATAGVSAQQGGERATPTREDAEP